MRWFPWSGAVLIAALAGCDQMNVDRTAAPLPETTAPASPDNTAINERDASGATKTPIDQDENQADVERTAEIRKRILDQPDLSISARNAKVMTSQGKVTLRGPVASEAERDTVVRVAAEVAGAENVDNQLEVASTQP